ncbi:hypothetical protein FB45DRAFT_66875 [Roridomyces roridus]|uniref:RING-type domain-containing protein n=1 Tax=Roridomyces roridus TaxID=1738132 RepID=A0AAD7BMA3_9AGAR|nr:hypothetical protein FB45DRAFT_66875 [Roridomyces roridus]
MSCGICLEKLADPLCLPCGHVYCAHPCLSGLVATTSTDFTAECPTCREPFHTVRPELACLPKAFHKFALPSLRRLYLDLEPSHQSTLESRLAASEARIATLESDKDRLLRAGEQHAAAARAHSRGETEALRKVSSLQAELQRARTEASRAQDKAIDLAGRLVELRAEQQVTAGDLGDASAVIEDLKAKYSKLKRHCRSLEASGREEVEADSSSFVLKKRNSDVAGSSSDVQGSTPKRLRVIRPLPRGRSSLQTPITAPLLARLGAQGGLGSPFRSGE